MLFSKYIPKTRRFKKVEKKRIKGGIPRKY